MDEKWRFNRDWEEMKKRVDKLEKDVYWLDRFKRDQEEKERQREYKNDNKN